MNIKFLTPLDESKMGIKPRALLCRRGWNVILQSSDDESLCRLVERSQVR